MSTSFLLAVLLVVLIGCALALWVGAKGDVSTYARNAALFSAAERSFLGVLDQAAGPGYRVFGKVRIADVVSVKKMANRTAWQRAFNKISAKHFDYVMCRADDLSFVCVVELDDKSHVRKERKHRDSFVEEVCSDAGLPLLRIPARHAYAVEEIRQQLQAILPAASGLVSAPIAPASTLIHHEHAAAAQLLDPPCPKCAGTMQKRKIHSGANNGAEFWGCNAFPTCRGMIPIA